MKSSVQYVGKTFSSHRMLLEYAQMFYEPALANSDAFRKDDFQKARLTAAYVEKLKSSWPKVGVTDMHAAEGQSPVLKVGDKLSVEASVSLGKLEPEEVAVELYFGTINSRGEFEGPQWMEMRPAEGESGATRSYRITVTCNATGRQGYTVRVLPKNINLIHPLLPGYMKWGT